jgi:FdhD protein
MQHLRPVSGAPSLSESGADLLREVEAIDETGERRNSSVPVERPLTILLDGRELVTLMTLGAKPELLTLGYLRNQRIIQDVDEIESINVDWSGNLARVLRRDARANAAQADGPRFTGTACSLGTEFGEVMRQVDAATLPPIDKGRLSRSQLLRMLEVSREFDAIHRAAGSVHGCALFAGGDLLVTLEDVSRHNGLDTVVGWMLLHGIGGEDKALFTTGRLTAEMVMKAAHNRISIMVSRNGVTSMGCELAGKLGMALFGRAAKGRYLCYTGAARFDDEMGGRDQV